MRRVGLLRAFGSLALAVGLWACAPAEAPPETTSGLRLSYEDVLAPGAFLREGPAVAEADGAAGYWAVVPGLRRPERARAVNVATGAEVTVALYAGRGGSGGAMRLSGAAAESLGIGDAPATVRVTALRRVPRLAPP